MTIGWIVAGEVMAWLGLCAIPSFLLWRRAERHLERARQAEHTAGQLEERLAKAQTARDLTQPTAAADATADAAASVPRVAHARAGRHAGRRVICAAWDLIGDRLYVCAAPPDHRDRHRTAYYLRIGADSTIARHALMVPYRWSGTVLDDLRAQIAILERLIGAERLRAASAAGQAAGQAAASNGTGTGADHG